MSPRKVVMKKSLVVLISLTLLTGCMNEQSKKVVINKEVAINKIALGSCIKEGKQAPIFTAINDYRPDVFAFLGDNIYGDTVDMKVLLKKYDSLAGQAGYQVLQNQSEVIATWDDHDYGRNDAGVEYPKKGESQKIFLDFFNEPQDSTRRKRQGIYTSYFYGPKDKKVQIILLDNRYHRTKLKSGKRNVHGGRYVPLSGPQSTMLGEAQWKWLEEELKKDATIRFIAGGTQILTEHNGFEAWANFPKELEKLINLLKKTRANGVIFLTGDTHWTEITKRKIDGYYALYDFTSSGLTEVYLGITPNKYRLEGMSHAGANFGAIEIDWAKKDPVITLKAIDVKGDIKFKHDIQLSELQFK